MMPTNLAYFLDHLGTEGQSRCKVTHIGHALMSLCKPRGPLLPSLQLLLGLKVHKQFGSRELVDILHAAGFSVSYEEICKFERCIAVTKILHEENTGNGYIQVSDDMHLI